MHRATRFQPIRLLIVMALMHCGIGCVSVDRASMQPIGLGQSGCFCTASPSEPGGFGHGCLSGGCLAGPEGMQDYSSTGLIRPNLLGRLKSRRSEDLSEPPWPKFHPIPVKPAFSRQSDDEEMPSMSSSRGHRLIVGSELR